MYKHPPGYTLPTHPPFATCLNHLQEFLEAMTAYYYGDKPKLTDEEFALLKEELIWNGSKVCCDSTMHVQCRLGCVLGWVFVGAGPCSLMLPMRLCQHGWLC